MTNIGSTSVVSLLLCLYGYTADIFWLEVSAKAWGLGLSFCSVLCTVPTRALEPSCMGSAARSHNNAVNNDDKQQLKK